MSTPTETAILSPTDFSSCRLSRKFRPVKNPFRSTTFSKQPAIGRLLLGGWLIAVGAVPLLGLGSAALTIAINCVAVAAGVCLLIHR